MPTFETVAVEKNATAYEKAAFASAVDPSGLHLGYTLLKLRQRDMARIGTLYLNGGTWHGTRVLTTWPAPTVGPT